MEKLIKYFFLLFSLSLAAQAQNLVPNYSFEQYDTCPNINSCIIEDAVGWQSFAITPDYFNSCDTTSNPSLSCSVPLNGGGYQPAASGNAYAGFYAYETHLNMPAGDTREYIAILLDSTLSIGVKYLVTLKVNPSFVGTGYFNCVCNKIGALFTTIPFFTGIPPSPLTNNFAHVYTDSIINDTAAWTSISGSFIADSAYQYIVVGNFFDDLNIDTLILNNDPTCRSYYFVDDVSVERDTTIGISQNQLVQQFNIYSGNGMLFIQSKTSLTGLLEIYNVLGQSVEKKSLTPFNSYSINLSNRGSTIYFVNINYAATNISKKIFIPK